MSNPKTVELTIEGSVPSKKNSRVRTRSGSYIPNKAFYDWQHTAIQQVRMQCRERFFNPVHVEVIIYFGTRGRADLDNRLTSILDMLVECVVLRDDKWQDVPRMAVQAEYRKGNPGAFIRISEDLQHG
jgi:Holliday junction resolvase RusA-like endonuclease